MDKRRPIQSQIDAGGAAHDETAADGDRFREALARWAASVTLVAARDEDGVVYATTVSSFAPLSAQPPRVVVCLGAGAQVVPFAEPGCAVGVSILHESQSNWATVYADSFPVRSAPWSEGDAPVLPDAAVSLTCSVGEMHPSKGGNRILVLDVNRIVLGSEDRPLLYWQRGYRRLDAD
jgi:flavin reductase (DIM6/NTAB) family NADH-FMN oxidoreductase RutF